MKNDDYLDTHEYSIQLCELLIRYINESGIIMDKIENPRLIAKMFVEHIDTFTDYNKQIIN